MPTLYVEAESPTAATIFLAAAAEDTSRATIKCCRASLIGRACIRRASIRRSFISRPRIKGEFKRFAAAGLWLKRHRPQHRYGLRLGHLRLNQIQTDPLQTLSLELEHASGAVRNVYDPAGNYGAAIIDFDDYRAPVAQIGDPHEAAQGQSWVGGGQVVHIIRLAAGGRLALEIVSIPGGGANLVGLRLSRFVARFL